MRVKQDIKNKSFDEVAEPFREFAKKIGLTREDLESLKEAEYDLKKGKTKRLI